MSFEDLNTLTNRSASTFTYSQAQIEAIISKYNDTSSPFIKDDLLIKRQFENLKKKQIQYNLHTLTLIEYLKTKRIPRGLRLNIRPTFCREDKNFCERWFQVLNKCSLDLIALTIEGIQSHLTTLDKSILDTEAKLKETLNPTELTSFLETTNITLDNYRSETLKIKLNKYRRDLTDYEEGRVYSWRDSRRPGQRQGPSTHSHSDTENSDSSVGSSRPFLDKRRPNQPRRPGGAKGTDDQRMTRSQARAQIWRSICHRGHCLR